MIIMHIVPKQTLTVFSYNGYGDISRNGYKRTIGNSLLVGEIINNGVYYDILLTVDKDDMTFEYHLVERVERWMTYSLCIPFPTSLNNNMSISIYKINENSVKYEIRTSNESGVERYIVDQHGLKTFR